MVWAEAASLLQTDKGHSSSGRRAYKAEFLKLYTRTSSSCKRQNTQLARVEATLLRSLLKPVKALSRVCQRVSHGDLDVSAPSGGSGEIGRLCWCFNVISKRISGLRQRDERRRLELEDLNQNLERKVRLRTRALERKAHKLEEANVRLKELAALKTNYISSGLPRAAHATDIHPGLCKDDQP